MAVTSGYVYTDKVSSQLDTGFYVYWSKQGNSDSTRNTTTISWEIHLDNHWAYYQRAVQVSSLIIDGNTVYSGGVWSNITETRDYTLATGTTTIQHLDDGTKTFSITLNGYLWENHNLTGTGSFTLPTIPRYATLVQELSSRTEKSLTIKWTANATCDRVWYKVGASGSWIRVEGSNASSGTYTISGLSVGTTYSIYTKVRRLDSQLETTSDALSVKTYSYPYATVTPDFNLGDELTITISNPLSRTVAVYLVVGGSRIVGVQTSGNKAKGYKSSSTVSYIYAMIPESAHGVYNVDVVYTDSNNVDHVSTKTNTDEGEGGHFYAVESKCGPVIAEGGQLTYADQVTEVQNIVQDTSVLVQNKSRAIFTLTGITSRFSASIDRVIVRFNNTSYSTTLNADETVAVSNLTGIINLSSNSTATAVVTDSRGFQTTCSCSVTIASWATPTSSASISRKNNFYSETYLTIDASVSPFNYTNTMSVTYTATASGETTITETVPINTYTGSVVRTLQCTNTKSWKFTITVTDALGKSYTYRQTIARGIPLMFWDRVKNLVGINRYPTTNALEVDKSFSVNDENGRVRQLGNVDANGIYEMKLFNSNGNSFVEIFSDGQSTSKPWPVSMGGTGTTGLVSYTPTFTNVSSGGTITGHVRRWGRVVQVRLSCSKSTAVSTAYGSIVTATVSGIPLPLVDQPYTVYMRSTCLACATITGSGSITVRLITGNLPANTNAYFTFMYMSTDT